MTHRAIANGPLGLHQRITSLSADELDVRGNVWSFFALLAEGAGAALVAVRREQAPQIPLRFAPPRVYTAVSAQ